MVVQFPSMKHNGLRYDKLPIAGDFLSSYTKVETGYKSWIYCWFGNYFYTLL